MKNLLIPLTIILLIIIGAETFLLLNMKSTINEKNSEINNLIKKNSELVDQSGNTNINDNNTLIEENIILEQENTIETENVIANDSYSVQQENIINNSISESLNDLENTINNVVDLENTVNTLTNQEKYINTTIYGNYINSL